MKYSGVPGTESLTVADLNELITCNKIGILMFAGHFDR